MCWILIEFRDFGVVLPKLTRLMGVRLDSNHEAKRDIVNDQIKETCIKNKLKIKTCCIHTVDRFHSMLTPSVFASVLNETTFQYAVHSGLRSVGTGENEIIISEVLVNVEVTKTQPNAEEPTTRQRPNKKRKTVE